MANIAKRRGRSFIARAASRRIVVKMRTGLALPYTDAALLALERSGNEGWRQLRQSFPDVRPEPYFKRFNEPALRAMRAGDVQPFTSYFAMGVAPGINASAMAARISALPEVEIAYAEAGPTPPPVEPENDVYSGSQGYLDPAPIGIDARYAWSCKIDGASVGFVDLEQGWILEHEDLVEARIQLISGVNRWFFGHGTAVLGQVVAVDNDKGCVGIAPAASASVVSQYRTNDDDDYSTADAILSAASKMCPGDVLLLEAQTFYDGYPGENDLFPVEVERVTFDAIVHATQEKGIVVVEAAGNGYRDLDDFRDTNGCYILDRNSSDFQDSGAIIVGAASCSEPHSRLAFSNYGNRVDCFAWGENVSTCGDGWEGQDPSGYTSTFGGTSGASPIVAGAAILVQHARRMRRLEVYDPREMRMLLSSPDWNTWSTNPAMDRIGVMPDLRAVLNR